MRKRQQGFTLIELLVVVAIIGVIAAIAIPGLMQARMSGNEVSALGSLRAINTAQRLYEKSCGEGYFAPTLENLGVPPPTSNEAYLDASLARPGATVTKAQYKFQMSGTPAPDAPASCNGLGAGATLVGYKAGADPQPGGGTLYFGTNTSGSVYQHTASLFSSMPENGKPSAGRPAQ